MKKKKRCISLLWKTVWIFLKKLEVGLPCDLEIPLPGIYSKEMKTWSLKRDLHPPVHCTIIHSSQDMEIPKCPSREEWIKILYIYIQDITQL